VIELHVIHLVFIFGAGLYIGWILGQLKRAGGDV